jgi:hypothetical protein
VRNSLSSKVAFNFASTRSFRNKATVTTANNAVGIAISRDGIKSTIIRGHFYFFSFNAEIAQVTSLR